MIRPPWHSDHALPPEAFAKAVAARFPQFSNPTVETLIEGWDSRVFRVDGEWVFKVPKRRDVMERLDQEIALLGALPTLPAATPRPELFAEPGDDIPYPFFGYRFIDGRFADHDAVDPAVVMPKALAFLEALHAVELDQAIEGWPTEGWTERLVTASRVARDTEGLDPIVAWLDANEPIAPEGSARILHADLGPMHMLVDPASQDLIGVLDWADATRDDPALDFAALVLWAPAAFRATFTGDEAVWQRARAIALMQAIEQLRQVLRWSPTEVAGCRATLDAVWAVE